MVKKLLPILLLIIYSNTYGQQNFKKIKIILLGTFHYGATSDSKKTNFDNLFTIKRQQELQDLRNKIALYNPDKVFVENEPERQTFWDSIYTNYKKNIEPDSITGRNEIFQVSIKLAKELHLSGVNCVDFYADKLEDSNYIPATASELALKNYIATINKISETDTNIVQSNPAFFNLKSPYIKIKPDSILHNEPLLNYYRFLNSPERLKENNFVNWTFLYSYGTDKEYLGVDYLANKWIARNMKIFTNILRTADLKKDNCYFVMYGSAHIPFLQHLFEQFPYFEVLNIADVLR